MSFNFIRQCVEEDRLRVEHVKISDERLGGELLAMLVSLVH
jgi:hypothetical protein